MESSNHSYCVNLPIYNNNKTFCGITEIWKARITSNTALVACVIPTIFAWLITLFIICHVQKHLFNIYKHNFQQVTKDKTETKNLIMLDDSVDGRSKHFSKEELHEINSVKSTSNGKENKSRKTKGTVTSGGSLKKNSNRETPDNKESEEVALLKPGVDTEDSKNNKVIELTDMNDVNDKISEKEDSNKTYALKSELTDNALTEKSIHGNGETLSHKDNNQKRYWCGIYIKKFYLVFSIIVLTNLKLLWDALDVTIDAYLFYQLETGKVIHEHIYRNIHVNNAILAFSILGCLKILFWLRIIGVGKTAGMKDLKTTENLKLLKLYFVAGTFIFEDGPELILEYFFVEKYMSKQLTWYLFARDIVLCIISLYTLVISSLVLLPGLNRIKQYIRGKNDKKRRGSVICQFVVRNICNVFIGLLLFLRAGGAGYQYVTGKMRRSCFTTKNGFLIQTPFTVGCMRGVDYFIITLSGMSILCSVFALFAVNHFLKNIYSPFSGIGRYSFWEFGYYKFC